VRLVLLDQRLLLEQRVEHALDRVRRPERLLQPRPAALWRDDGELAGTNVSEPTAVEDQRNAGSEERLADNQPAAAADLDDDSV
jgi:hypothetical protein